MIRKEAMSTIGHECYNTVNSNGIDKINVQSTQIIVPTNFYILIFQK